MAANPDRRQRRSIRLRGYDYTQLGAYFITICTYQGQCLFGHVLDGAMVFSDAARIVRACWDEISVHFPNVELDEFVIMPNHVHGIMLIVHRGRGTACRGPTVESFGKPVPGSLATTIRSFKSAVTKRINQQRKTPGGSVWQRNYYEHVMRDEAALARIRDYIGTNPLRWALDRENPSRAGTDDFDRWLEAYVGSQPYPPVLPVSGKRASPAVGG